MSGVLLLPRVRCPKCGAPPPLRITEAERELAQAQPDRMEKVTVQCGTGWCRHIYTVTAGAYRQAA